MADNQSDTMDSSESLEETTNDTSRLYINYTAAPEPDEARRWDSDAHFWLAVVIVLLSLLVMVNILVYIKCVRTVNRSLCDVFNDLILYVFGLIVTSRARRDKPASGGPSVLYKTGANSVEFIDGYRPSPFCCFTDRFHQEAETAAGENLANLKPNLIENRVEENTVDMRVKKENQGTGGEQEEKGNGGLKEEKASGDVRVKKENKSMRKQGEKAVGGQKEEKTKDDPRMKMEDQPTEGKPVEKGNGGQNEEKAIEDPRVKTENQPVGQKDNVDDRYMGNLNKDKDSEKIVKKVKLPTVPEEQMGPGELVKGRAESAGADTEPTYARVIKPSSATTTVDAAVDPDPEIFI